jgi:hypothetical protein
MTLICDDDGARSKKQQVQFNIQCAVFDSKMQASSMIRALRFRRLLEPRQAGASDNDGQLRLVPQRRF